VKNSGHKPRVDEASHYAVAPFTRELIDAVARDRYRLRAWQTLLSRSWARSLEDIRESRARTRSSWSWAAATAAAGAAIILLAMKFQSAERALTASLLWLPWFAGAVFFLLTHLGMVDDSRGMPHQRLLLPNGLSFLRLALAPLVLWPCLQVPVHPVAGSIFALFMAGLVLSDLLDGWLARRLKLCTRMGRMLDVLADLALVTFLAVGLYLAGVIPGSLLLLLIVRYPMVLPGALVLVLVRGPVPLRPTIIGKVTTFAASATLLVVACKTLLPISWPPQAWIEWSIGLLYFLLGVNILYLIKRGISWSGQRKDDSSNSDWNGGAD